MTILSNAIVYVWLLPVVAQIILPLGMLAFWLVGRPLYRLMSSPVADSSSAAVLSGAVTK